MKRFACVIAIISSFLAFSIASLNADEPAQAFLDALRDNGYHDVAIEYLESLQNSELVSAEFKSVLPFELAQTLIGSTATMRDLTKVETQLDKAQKLLTDYAAGNQSVEVSARTLHYQGNLLDRRSKIYLSQAESDRLTAAEKGELHAKARTNLASALESYTAAKAKIRLLIDPQSASAIQIDPEDPSTSRKRDQFRASYADVRVSIPQIAEQLADTQEPGSGERVKLLKQARDEYKKVWDAYPRFLAGLNSCLYSARCSYKLGEHKQALQLLNEIFALSNNSVFKPIKRQAYVLATECWSKLDPYPYTEVVQRLDPAVKLLNKIEIKQPQWLRVQLELAIAMRAKSVEVKSKGGPTSNREGKDMERAAAKVLRNVTRVPGPFRDRAKQLLSKWDVKITTAAEVVGAPPASFEEARDKAKEIVTDLESAVSEASLVRKKLAREKDPAKKLPLQTQYDELSAQVASLSKSALSMFENALSMSTDETVRADINNVRYLQCYCYFADQKYIESSLIAEFLLAKYPNVEGTRQAMTLLIQSYSVMMDRAKEADKADERNRLATAATNIIKRWPGSNEAGAAASSMTRLALNQKDFDMAKRYFAEIPAKASYRNVIGLKLGQRIWYEYKKNAKATDADPAKLQAQLDESKQFLVDGVRGVTVDDMTYDTALGALFLVDVHLRYGDVKSALEQLESSAIAPLDLVKQKHPVVTNTSAAALYRREAYQIAIKTYLAAMESGDNQEEWVRKAGGIVNAMREEMKASQDPKARARVTQIYQMIARELKENFESIDDVNKKKRFAKTLAMFLDSIVEDSTDGRIVIWAGSTLRTVAESLQDSDMAPESVPLFQSAAAALSKAESIGFAGEPEEKAMLSELKRQRALAQRGSGSFEASVQQFVEILRESPNSLAVQIDAAKTLQQWGKVNGGPIRYKEAVKGAEPYKDPKTKRSRNLIWGWEKLALATRGKEGLRPTFNESLFHLIESRMEYGVMTKSQKAIDSAGREIQKERKRDSTFGGSPEWKSKFDALEKRVNATKVN